MPGPVETEVIADIEALGELDGYGPTLAATAYRLAQALDADEADARTLASISKELRATMVQLFDLFQADGDADVDLGLTA